MTSSKHNYLSKAPSPKTIMQTGKQGGYNSVNSIPPQLPQNSHASHMQNIYSIPNSPVLICSNINSQSLMSKILHKYHLSQIWGD